MDRKRLPAAVIRLDASLTFERVDEVTSALISSSTRGSASAMAGRVGTTVADTWFTVAAPR